MDIIFPANKLIISILGLQQKIKDGPYRLLSFCISIPVSKGTLIYNNLTKELTLFENNDNDEDYLVSNWFYVPSDLDEISIANKINEVLRTVQLAKPAQKNYTILTTTGCNARCFYCYEKGLQKLDMNEDTALSVAKFISRSNNKMVHINWFGGEPLYCLKPINIICEHLRKTNIPYESTMISNGYLFTSDVIDLAKRLWNLKKVQITLDGTEEIYNSTKSFIYTETNPFSIVCNNILSLISVGVHVNIRLNVDKYNISNLFLLIDYLDSIIENKTIVSVCVSPLYENSGITSRKRSPEERFQIFQSVKSLEDYAFTHGFTNRDMSLKKYTKIYSCGADNPNSIVISPDGNLYRCEHINSNNPICKVSDRKASTFFGVWKEYLPANENCSHCPLYPSCFRLKGCQEYNEYRKEYCLYKIESLKNKILYTYENSPYIL